MQPSRNGTDGKRAGRARAGVWALAVIPWLGGAGCESLAPPHQAWTEARVVGRVLDGQTQQPVVGATVTRVRGPVASTGGFGDEDKGGPQMVDRPAVASTGPDGRFVLEGVRTAYLFLESFPDYAVMLRVRAAGFPPQQGLFTNVTYGGPRTNEPVVNAGDILLMPKGGVEGQ